VTLSIEGTYVSQASSLTQFLPSLNFPVVLGKCLTGQIYDKSSTMYSNSLLLLLILLLDVLLAQVVLTALRIPLPLKHAKDVLIMLSVWEDPSCSLLKGTGVLKSPQKISSSVLKPIPACILFKSLLCNEYFSQGWL